MWRYLALIVIVLGVDLARGQVPYPHGGGQCATDWDCSLGGLCAASLAGAPRRCACDAWFTGPSCAHLNLQPARADAGLQAPGYNSWGGHPLYSADDGLYHTYVSLMCRGSSLNDWKTLSSIAHATSPRVDGPYTLAAGVDAQLVVPPW